MGCDVLKAGVHYHASAGALHGGSVHWNITPGIVPSSCPAKEESIWSKGSNVLWAINVYLGVLEKIYEYIKLQAS